MLSTVGPDALIGPLLLRRNAKQKSCSSEQLFKDNMLLCEFLIDRDACAFLVERLEADFAVNEGKQRVVAAFSDVFTRMNMCAALPDKDVAGKNELPVGTLRP
jgi:hypothetical protein